MRKPGRLAKRPCPAITQMLARSGLNHEPEGPEMSPRRAHNGQPLDVLPGAPRHGGDQRQCGHRCSDPECPWRGLSHAQPSLGPPFPAGHDSRTTVFPQTGRCWPHLPLFTTSPRQLENTCPLGIKHGPALLTVSPSVLLCLSPSPQLDFENWSSSSFLPPTLAFPFSRLGVWVSRG